MATKRLTFEVDEAVHSCLKAEAAQLGVHLGTYCAGILEGRGEIKAPLVKTVDQATISTLPLDKLRTMNSELVNNKPNGWEQSLNMINSEIRRRYRV